VVGILFISLHFKAVAFGFPRSAALFDVHGNTLNTLEKKYENAGAIEERIDLLAMGSGGYFVRITTDRSTATLRFEKQ